MSNKNTITSLIARTTEGDWSVRTSADTSEIYDKSTNKVLVIAVDASNSDMYLLANSRQIILGLMHKLEEAYDYNAAMVETIETLMAVFENKISLAKAEKILKRIVDDRSN